MANDPHRDPSSLGNLLLSSGVCTREQLDAALQYQEDNADVMLGEALVRLGVVPRAEIEVHLAHQKGKRNGKKLGEVVALAGEGQQRLRDRLDGTMGMIRRLEARIMSK